MMPSDDDVVESLGDDLRAAIGMRDAADAMCELLQATVSEQQEKLRTLRHGLREILNGDGNINDEAHGVLRVLMVDTFGSFCDACKGSGQRDVARDTSVDCNVCDGTGHTRG